VVETQDSGISLFDPDEIPPPGLDVAQTHGYGLFLIRALVDDVSCQLKKGHNRWRLVKELE
jgi:anti-sigma regulatory factor (Ser/Thr protein kinase)